MIWNRLKVFAAVLILAQGFAAKSDVTLAWNPSTAGAPITNYIVYWGTNSGSYVLQANAGTQTNLTVTGLAPNTVYYFAVTATDQNGMESPNSNETAFTNPPLVLTITANSRTKPYGQSVTFAGTEFTTSGLQNGDTVSSVTLTSSGAAATATAAGSPYSIVPSAAVGTGLNNYMISYANGALTVNSVALTVTASNRTKTYGQSVTFAGTEFTTSGLQNSDTVSSVTLTSSGAAATATAAGSPYSIVPSAAVGAGLNNYTISYANGALTVSSVALTITANSRTKPYGQNVTFAGTEFTTSGLQNSDTVSSVTLTSPGAAATATAAGSPYSIVPSAAVGTGLANYPISYVNGTLTVNQATPTITWTNPIPIIYGTSLTTNELNATANVPGSFEYAPTNGSALDTGTNALSVIFTPTNTGDYNGTTNAVSLFISNAVLTVTAADANRGYSQTNPVFTGTITGVTNGDNIAATYSTPATISSPVGTYPIVPSLVDTNNRQTNYTVSLTNGTLTILAGPLAPTGFRSISQ